MSRGEFQSDLDPIPGYYARWRQEASGPVWQPLKDHLTGSASLASILGQDAGVGDLAYAAALLHDIGKYSEAFQERLRGSNRKVDHATAGAREILSIFPSLPQSALAELLSYCIAGHHSGLPDYGNPASLDADEGTLIARRQRKALADYSTYKTELDTSALALQFPRLRLHPEHPGFSLSFLTRIIFSALVDADWLDTERFMDGGRSGLRGRYATIDDLAAQLNGYLARFSNPQTPINRKRTETLLACQEHASRPQGLFTLTIPTGGGKTLASMSFSLQHAAQHRLRRVIYVIPFTSIIEQNAAVFRQALGALGPDNVLEHHANFEWQDPGSEDELEVGISEARLKLATENWDVPIVVTTNVQFFESLFASRKTSARKLHNLARSVIIFDEAQVLPRQYLKPCMLAIAELVNNYAVSAVFCTATQPSLQQFFPAKTPFFELAPHPQDLYSFYRRVEVRHAGQLKDIELLDRLNAAHQVLCIVNTRRHASGLFDGLDPEGSFHLSTLMCPAHRKQTLGEIRQRLDIGAPCRVVSTQVMEAGIDVDFPLGYRSMAGLDSIIQAAGRINREMKLGCCQMFVFEPQTEMIRRTPIFISQTASVAKTILRDHADDPVSIEAIEAYYQLLYTLQDDESFDARGILNLLDRGPNRLEFDFRSAGERFKLIENNTVPLVIPFNAAAIDVIDQLRHAENPRELLRSLQHYTTNIYEQEFRRLQERGVIVTLHDHLHLLDPKAMAAYYSAKTGLQLPEGSGGEAIFFDG